LKWPEEIRQVNPIGGQMSGKHNLKFKSLVPGAIAGLDGSPLARARFDVHTSCFEATTRRGFRTGHTDPKYGASVQQLGAPGVHSVASRPHIGLWLSLIPALTLKPDNA
jgi:hypothetical protein